MSESHTCKVCGKLATVHLTQIVGNQIQKVDLCESCAHEKGVTDPQGFSLTDLITSPMVAAVSGLGREAMTCEQCGFSPKDFKKLGRFGCPYCYESFSALVTPMLRNMHRDVVHRGKVPTRSEERMRLRNRLTELEGSLLDAVRDERFEDAAQMRDEIALIQDTLQEGAPTVS